MPKEFAVSRKGMSGLAKQEITEVLSALRLAKTQGELPALSYEVNQHPGIFGKDPIYITPKSADSKRTAAKVRQILRRRFGDKYTVYLV